MSKIYTSATQLIGHTPLLKVTNYSKDQNIEGVELLAKLEYFNPAGSVKDRIALAMIEDAEKKGILKEGSTIIEPTSGNTGIGLASVAAAKGYRTILTLPETMSVERRNLLKAYGAELVLTEGAKGMKGAIAKAEELEKSIPGAVILGQFDNPANPAAHAATTGPEIWEDTDGKVDIFVAGVGTGGTVSGTGKYLKSKNPDLYVVALQPGKNSLPSPENPAPEEIMGVHPFAGVPREMVPEIMDMDIYDERYDVETPDAYRVTREVAKTDGILVGTSSGAAIFAATEIAKRPENAGKNIVVILPDTGLRYLSTNLFNEDFEV